VDHRKQGKQCTAENSVRAIGNSETVYGHRKQRLHGGNSVGIGSSARWKQCTGIGKQCTVETVYKASGNSAGGNSVQQ
jgi:hypothetical protein